MLLVGLLYCYMGITFFNFGFAFRKLLNIKEAGSTITIVLGMFFITMAASIWAIFGRLNWEFQLSLLLIQLWIMVRYISSLWSVYRSIFVKSKALDKSLKLFLALTTFLIVFYTSASHNLIDNETYYIQTIKWLDQYGFTPGLGNLHIFFVQTSGWHILQSAFSFTFLTAEFNDLNGFCLILGIAFSIDALQAYLKTRKTSDLGFGLLSIFLLFLLPITGAPSPDLPAIILSIFLFRILIDHSEQPNLASFVILSIIASFIVYIKIATLPIVLLPFLFYCFNKRQIALKFWPGITIAFLVLFLFIAKNVILSGYPLYPSALFAESCRTEMSIPKASYDFWWNRSEMIELVSLKQNALHNSSFTDLFNALIERPIKGIGRFLTISLIVLTPIFLNKREQKKVYWFIYLTMIVQAVFLICTVPEIRFMVAFVIFFVMLMVSHIPLRVNLIKVLVTFAIFPAVAVALFLKPQSQHHHLLKFKSSSLSVSQLWTPKANSNLNTHFERKRKGNLLYYYPDSTAFIWATGDGQLPCVNEKQIDYFERRLGYRPQQIGKSVKDGFYSQKIEKP